MSSAASTALTAISPNTAFTEYQQVMVDAIAWGEKRMKLIKNYADTNKDYGMPSKATQQFEHLKDYVNTFLAKFPYPSPHKGLLIELSSLFGLQNSIFQDTLRTVFRPIFPKELTQIIVLYVDNVEPTLDDVIDGNKMICKPDFTSAEVALRVRLIMQNLQNGLYS